MYGTPSILQSIHNSLISSHSLFLSFSLMDAQPYLPATFPLINTKTHKNNTRSNLQSCPTTTNLPKNMTNMLKYSNRTFGGTSIITGEEKARFVRKGYGTKAVSEVKEKCCVKEEEKKGSVGGAVALIIGTSIGSGILALPQKASPAGLLPSSFTMIICWAFLVIEAFLLIEINVGLRRTKNKKEEQGELEIISIRTMAQETLGDWGGNLATITYVFLCYTSIVAYSSKSGEILFHMINLPESVSGFLFTIVFSVLIFVGGTRITDQVNQWLTAFMIGFLVAIEVLAVWLEGWSGFGGSDDWGKVPATIPVMIFSLVYHDIIPVLCAYLGGDIVRLRTSVLIGSVVPLVALLVWDAIALGLSTDAHQFVDPVDLFTRVKWGGVSVMVETFSLLAVGTSLIGTLLSFFEFYKEQLKNLPLSSASTKRMQKQNQTFWMRNWWGKNKISLTAMAMVVTPSLFVSTTVPDAFSTATDIAGGYGMTMLYGVLPPAMALAMYSKTGEDSEQKSNFKAKSAVLGVGLFACGIVATQILQDFLAWHQ